jgi:hypothetical protein
LVLLQALQQPEGVAATDEDDVGSLDGAGGVRNVMHGCELKAHGAKTVFCLGCVRAAIVECVWNEDDTGVVAGEGFDFTLGMIEVSTAVQSRIADQQEMWHIDILLLHHLVHHR